MHILAHRGALVRRRRQRHDASSARKISRTSEDSRRFHKGKDESFIAAAEETTSHQYEMSRHAWEGIRHRYEMPRHVWEGIRHPYEIPRHDG